MCLLLLGRVAVLGCCIGSHLVSLVEAPELRITSVFSCVARGFIARVSRSNFHKSIWSKARESVGMPDLHFHDLRHTGGTLSAATGATLKELMARLGHSSVRAAMIYQHPTRDRDQAIAKALGTFVRDARDATERPARDPETGQREA